MRYREEERRPKMWRDVSNNFWIPEEYPSQKGDGYAPPFFEWAILSDQYREYLENLGIHKTYEEITNDPYHLWAVVNYISTYSTDERPIRVKYFGPQDAWRTDLKRLLACYKGLYGCVTDKDITGIDEDKPASGTYERQKNKAQVELDCQRIGGKFVELSEFMEKTMLKIIENALKNPEEETTERDAKVFALYERGESQASIAGIMHMSLRDVNRILKDKKNLIIDEDDDITDGNDDGNDEDDEYDEEFG